MPPQLRLSTGEFIALIAMMFATVAFSMDSMLPALPDIAAELSPGDPNRAQLILSSFILGMGAGTFVVGPLSDAFGRKTVIAAGAVIYCLAAAAAWAAPTLETVLAARLVQGLGAAAPRIVTLAMVRDLYKGREMARIVSFAMTIFSLVPAIAPLMGSFIMAGVGWRGLFLAFVIFVGGNTLWMMLRQPETLDRADRRPLHIGSLLRSLVEILTNRIVLTSTLVQSLVYGMLFGNITSIQPIFDRTFGMAKSFPWWFAAMAVLAGSSSFVNAALVVRLGMRRIVGITFMVLAISSVAMLGVVASGVLQGQALFALYFLWSVGVFFSAGLTMGNLNALALEPMGHIAGAAASAVGAISTVLGVLIAVPIGLAFDGTVMPIVASVAVMTVMGMAVMRTMPGR